MLAIVAPGQGSQVPGFLLPWLENSQSSSLIDHWSSIINLDLRALGTTAEADEIRETSNAQPLLVAAGLIAFARLRSEFNFEVSAFAGHSVGEITALGAANVLDFESAMKLVRVRGSEMSQAALGSNTGMAAVLGGDREVVVAHLSSLDLTAANENGAGQIVAAGSATQLALLGENPPAGSRVRPLAVSGAFHTSVMAAAVPVLRELASQLEVHDSSVPILSNKDGASLNNGEELLTRIVGQIAGPVRWDLCMDRLSALGITGVLELPPAGTLVGLIKRAAPDIETFALKSPDDLTSAQEFIARHGGN